MADPTYLTKPRTPTGPTFSTGFLLKCLLCALFLLAFPLFPSEAPAFISHTHFTSLWELLYHLFIGIAVSYGLFSSRNAEERNQASDFPESHSSRMESFLSIFDDDGCHEKGQLQCWDSGQNQSETSGLDEKLKSFNSRNGVEVPCVYEENPEIQSRKSQYFQCPPMIVVARPNYSLDDDSDNKPLGLPVRSLRSIIADPIRTKPRTRRDQDSSTGSGDSPISSDGCENGNFRELGPLNLGEKFNETVSLPSPIPRPSRLGLGRMEERRDLKPTALKQLLHSRHLSVEESQLMHHKSRPLRSNACSESHTSSISSSLPNGESPISSAAPDLLEVKIENILEKKVDPRSSVMACPYDGGTFFELNSRKCAGRVSLEETIWENTRDQKDYGKDGMLDSSHPHESSKHAQKKFGNVPKHLSDDEMQNIPENRVQAYGSHSQNRSNASSPCRKGDISCKEGTQTSSWSSKRDDNSNSCYSEGSVQGSLKLNVRPREANTRTSYMGKSVRTFRANWKTMERERIEQTCEGNTVGKVQHKPNHLGQSYPRIGEELGAFANEFVFSNEDGVGRSLRVASSKSSNYQNHEEEKFQNMQSINSEEEVVEFQAESNSDSGDDIDNISDTGTEACEVDKKAGEFIAKFREQIRLQKTASIDSSSVLDVTEDHYQ